MRCTICRDAAEHVAESLTCGDRVVVQGRLRQRSFETRDGDKRTVIELEVDEIGRRRCATRSEGDQGQQDPCRVLLPRVGRATVLTPAPDDTGGTDAHTTHHRHPHPTELESRVRLVVLREPGWRTVDAGRHQMRCHPVSWQSCGRPASTRLQRHAQTASQPREANCCHT